MSFTTVAFFVFLLAGIVVYYVLPKNVQWIWLLILSYIYYFTFSIKASLFMVFATVTIYFGGIWLQNIQNTGDRYLKDNKETLSREDKKAYKESLRRKKRWVLFLILLLDFGMLAVVKYSNFAIENINSVLGLMGKEPIGLLGMGLPLGISFFTFQSVSYAIDVYQGKYECEKNIFKMGLFVSFFPQLLQGPIGRYDRLGKQLYSGHSFNLKNVEYGLQRIGWGLFKKVVIADRAAVLVLNVFNNYEAYSGFHYIMAVLMYSVDLYMDFSGGIDIVIGAAQMFGITMDENFRQPYFSKSIGEFWRRWHISLSTWFREYVYIPLGGNRKGDSRTITNLLIVWMLTGFWHGAAWNFVAWGLYYGIILILEKFVWGQYVEKWPGAVRHIYAMVLILIGWVLFFSPSLGYALKYVGVMFGIRASGLMDKLGWFYLLSNWLIYLMAVLGSSSIGYRLMRNIQRAPGSRVGKYIMTGVMYLVMFALSLAFLVTQSFNPFLYFRF